jgi:hypothetical protein
VNTKVVINNHVLITNETNGRFCAEHKQPEMVDVISNVANMKVVIKGRISITQMKQVEDFVKNIKNMIWLMLTQKVYS